MKKFILGALTALLAVPVFGHPPIMVFVDDIALSFDQPPIIQDDRTLVPMRGIFQAMGATVTWNEPAKMVKAVQGEDTIIFHVGAKELYKNGEVIHTMSVPAQIINDRLLVPLRAIAQSLGAGVSWDGVRYEIRINSDGSSTTILPGHEMSAEPQVPVEPQTFAQSPAPATPAIALSALIPDSEQELEELWLAGFGALIAEDKDAFYVNAEKKLKQNLEQVQYYLTEDSIWNFKSNTPRLLWRNHTCL